MSGTSDRGPRVCGLASARDRARLREREAAERARVERVLARGPENHRRRTAGEGERGAGAATCVCRVCGGSEVALDLVRDRGILRLARCGRCDFMWTERWAEARPERETFRAGERVGERFAPRIRRPVDARVPVSPALGVSGRRASSGLGSGA